MEMTVPAPPKTAGYTWRPIRRTDAAALHRMLIAVEAEDRRGFVDTMDERERDLEDPASNFETDSMMAFTPDGEVAAMGWIFAPEEADQFYLAYLWGEVHPEHRRRGLGEAVLTWMEARGRAILASRPAGKPRFLRQSTLDRLTDRVALLEAHGFEPARYNYRMRRDLSQPIPEVVLPGGVTLQHWQPELDAELIATFNEAFQDHWGFIPITEELWGLWMTGHPDFRPGLTFVAMDEQRGRVAGFSLNQVRTAEIDSSGIREGWIQELAVRRAYRRQGIATALMIASMRVFKESGLEYAGLGVDTENLTGALRIYERLGFESTHRYITFSKPYEPDR